MSARGVTKRRTEQKRAEGKGKEEQYLADAPPALFFGISSGNEGQVCVTKRVARAHPGW